PAGVGIINVAADPGPSTDGGIVGAPVVTETGVFNFTVRASDGNGGTADRAFSMTITNTAPAWTSPAAGALTAQTEGVAMTAINLVGSDAEVHSLSFAVSAGALPTGLSISSVNGTTSQIVGTPSSAG